MARREAAIATLLPALALACSSAPTDVPDSGELPDADAAVDGAAESSTDAENDTSDASASVGLHVVGNTIQDGAGKTVRLLGVNRSGSEYMCVNGGAIFDGPVDDNAIAAMKTWTANAVRVPLNEDCWLALNGVAPNLSGMAYKQAISDFVDRILAHGMYPIVELHWTAPGTTLATKQVAMPDKDHSIAFWSDVAATFGAQRNIIFELFNEPFPDTNQDTAAAWTCWRSGGTCPGITYQAAGMQDMLDAVRQAGAHNLVLMGGVEYSNSLSGWVAHLPVDPDKNVAAAWHVYDFQTPATARLATTSTQASWPRATPSSRPRWARTIAPGASSPRSWVGSTTTSRATSGGSGTTGVGVSS